MTASVQFSNNYWAKRKRIQRLPKLYENYAEGVIKKDMIGIMDAFHDGISDDAFGLDALAGSTVKQKIRMGYEKPGTPLYGKGDREPKKSYANMWRIRKVAEGWKLFASWAKHHKSKLTLRHLLAIHEKGITITLPNGTLIRIPPRPAFLYAQRKFASDKLKNKKERAREVKKAIKKFIMDADDKIFKTYDDFKNNKEYDE